MYFSDLISNREYKKIKLNRINRLIFLKKNNAMYQK